MSSNSKYMRIRSAGAKAVGVVAAGALAVSLMPAAAFAAVTDGNVANAGVQGSVSVAAAGDDEATVTTKTDYAVSMSVSITGANEATVTGFMGGSVRIGRQFVTVDAMTNPAITITSGETKFADAVAIGEDGKITLAEAAIVGSYTAVVTSDNFNDVTVNFDYPAVSKTTIGGASYDYLDADAALQYVDADAQAAALADYKKIGDTNIYYKVSEGSSALSGTLYGMDMNTVTKYSDYYAGLGLEGLNADDYDAVSSATKFTSHHAGDISSLVSKDMETGTITGVSATTKTIDDADAYVEASILAAAGADLTEAQTTLVNSIRLNSNAMVDPATVTDRVAIDTVTASGFCTGYTYFTQYDSNATKHYGDTKITIRPQAGSDDSTYTWADYYSSLYAATIADGNGNVAGMAPWIDLYAEGGHGAVEIAIADGQNMYAAHEATVSRFSNMYDASTGRLKAGKYTVTLYAAGYNNLVYTFEVSAAAPSKDLMSIELQNTAVADGSTATVTSTPLDNTGAVATTYVTDAAVADNTIALDTLLVPGEDVIVSVTSGDSTYQYTLTVPMWQVITASDVTKTFGNKAFNLGATLTVGEGALSYASSNAKVAAVDANGKVTIKGAGKAEITITAAAAGNFDAAEKTVTVTVNKANNPIKVKAKTATVKYSKVKKSAQKLAVKKVLTVTKNQGKVTYKRVSGNKKIAVASNGKVTVKKGLKKGTYKVKTKVICKGTANYKAKTITKTFKVKVK